jgi:hypothetical protein
MIDHSYRAFTIASTFYCLYQIGNIVIISTLASQLVVMDYHKEILAYSELVTFITVSLLM